MSRAARGLNFRRGGVWDYPFGGFVTFTSLEDRTLLFLLASERRFRALGPFVAIVLLVLLAVAVGPSAGQERIVSKQDADRIFGLTRSQWEAEARRMVDSQTWRVWPGPGDQGTAVIATDPKTGVGLAVRPAFRDGQGPPETLVVGSYYPVGTFRRFSDKTRREMEAAAGSDFGTSYSVAVAFSSTASPAPGFDVVEVIITRTRR